MFELGSDSGRSPEQEATVAGSPSHSPTHRFLFYNTHLFSNFGVPCLGAAVGEALPCCLKKRVVYHDQSRLRQIAAILNRVAENIDQASDAASGVSPVSLSVVGLSEVWSSWDGEAMRKLTSQAFPYSYRPAYKSAFLRLGSGLLLLSKYPLRACHFEPFEALVGEDAMSSKGVATAIVELPSGQEVLVAVTHVQAQNKEVDVAARRDNVAQLAGILARRRSELKPGSAGTIVVLGDMNIDAGSDEYLRAFSALSTFKSSPYEAQHTELGVRVPLLDGNPTLTPPALVDLSDAWDHEPGDNFTYDALKNPLAQVFCPGDKHCGRIDFFWVSDNCRVVDRNIYRNWTMASRKLQGIAVPLSDHWALSVDLRFQPQGYGT